MEVPVLDLIRSSLVDGVAIGVGAVAAFAGAAHLATADWRRAWMPLVVGLLLLGGLAGLSFYEGYRGIARVSQFAARTPPPSGDLERDALDLFLHTGKLVTIRGPSGDSRPYAPSQSEIAGRETIAVVNALEATKARRQVSVGWILTAVLVASIALGVFAGRRGVTAR